MATYEMFWDCPRCDTPKLLGKSHRHCPNCGAAQEPDWRYFPPEDEKVAVEDHTYVGVDRVCPACDSPNSAAADFCTNCGSPLDGAAAVGVKASVDEGHQRGSRTPKTPPPRPDPPEEPSGIARAGMFGGLFGTGCLGFVGLVVAGFALLCCLNVLWTDPVELTVTGHSWTRTIEIEKLSMVTDDDWCDELPRGAVETSRRSKKKSSRKVEDGQTCKTLNVDQGDGTFKKVEKCRTKYREEPIEAPWCTYEVPKWKKTDQRRATGGLDDRPTWPKVKVDGCKRRGCTREGERTERYEVTLKEAGGETHRCAFSEAKWRGMKVGSSWTGEKGMVTGGLTCSGLKAK